MVFGVVMQFFTAGLLLSHKLCIFLLLDYFQPRNYGFIYNVCNHVYPAC